MRHATFSDRRERGREDTIRSKAILDAEPGGSLETIEDLPGFNRESLLIRPTGDRELMTALVTGFLGDVPIQVAALKEYIGAAGVRSAERQAHTIKGAAANVGAEALREAAYEMEKAGKTGNLKALSTAMPQLEKELFRLEACLEEEMGDSLLET